jgi:IclR family KDG regulon transcriptional repressor
MENKYHVHTVKHAMQIIKLFTNERQGWTLSEIATEKRWNITTTKRLLDMLVKYGYLQKNRKKIYSLDYTILRLSGIVQVTLDIYREAKPYILKLVETYGEAIHIGILEGTKVIYLEKAESQKNVALSSYVGKGNPAYCTACGKILLAYKEKKNQQQLLQEIEEEGLVIYCSNTVKNIEELKAQLQRISETGYVICNNEFSEGITSIGVPIYDYNDNVIAAISITGPQESFGKQELVDLLQVGKELSINLGYIPK